MTKPSVYKTKRKRKNVVNVKEDGLILGNRIEENMHK